MMMNKNMLVRQMMLLNSTSSRVLMGNSMVRGFYYPDANHHHLNQEVSDRNQSPIMLLPLKTCIIKCKSLFSQLFWPSASSSVWATASAILTPSAGMACLWPTRRTGTLRMTTLTLRPVSSSMMPSRESSTSISTIVRSSSRVSRTASTSSCPCIPLSDDSMSWQGSVALGCLTSLRA